MTKVKSAHFVVVPLAMWGHLRPLLHLSLNLLSLHPHLHLTILVTPSTAPRVESELKSTSFAHIYTKSTSASGTSTPISGTGPGTTTHHTSLAEQQEEDKAIVDRLQIITCICISPEFHLPDEWTPETMAQEGIDYAKTLPSFIKALMSRRHRFDGTRNKFEDIPLNFMIYDCFQTFIPDVMKGVISEIQMPSIPLIGFVPSDAAASYHTFAKEENGGSFAKMQRHVDEDIAKGRDVLEAYGEHGFKTEGRVKTIPGLPPKFDYEWWPNFATIPMPPQAFMSVVPSVQAVNDGATKGLICPTSADLEPEAVKALEKELGKRIYMVGPQFPDAIWAGEHPGRKAKNDDDERVFAFLDKMGKKYGPDSVIYVRITLLSWIAQVPQELLDELKDDENCCVVKFAPQWEVVNHEATGYFLSHCGSNSTAEAMLAELPMVCMPFAADQGEFTSMLSEIYKVAIDLKQVKTFSKPEFNKLYDGTTVVGTEEAIKAELKETWEKIRGPEGKAMRQRMKELKAVVKQSWESGRSKRDMVALGTCFE
ncbi:hypothetical protein L486_05228 [Kwoniella mangroviensis CBS 10435]|uniref:UDP-glycosyltransferases domain-containing protein n=1 Tax=Kwoniella mangroviensis CBS 10435 TaxID=1331196 RepID=A0A1B9IQE4_9TREE|nr:hypothetical protein L486_05228 [Kwoniella mangroviensis CBS 10435]